MLFTWELLFMCGKFSSQNKNTPLPSPLSAQELPKASSKTGSLINYFVHVATLNCGPCKLLLKLCPSRSISRLVCTTCSGSRTWRRAWRGRRRTRMAPTFIFFHDLILSVYLPFHNSYLMPRHHPSSDQVGHC
jgi:hypothetical protein